MLCRHHADAQKTGFHFIQYIETNENIPVIFQFFRLQFFHDVAIHHTLISNAEFCEIVAVAVINIA